MTIRWPSTIKDSKGASAVEFALLAPVLFVLAVGIARFGIVLNNYIMLTEAVTDGARQLALARGSSTPYSAAVSAVQASASNLASGSLTITTSINGTACATDTACQTALSTASGNPAAVSATYPCSLVVMGVNFAPSCTLSATTTEMIE
jgi:Flp pilus assembly protein TadG